MGFIEGAVASSSTALPLQRLIEATMRGNAESQAQAQVKDVAGRQAEATSKLQIKMTADPNDPGNPNIEIKNAKADLLNQTQGSDLTTAYTKPKQNVEAAIAKLNAPQVSPGEFQREALTAVGFPPARTDIKASELNTYGRDYRAQRELGEPIIKAAIKAAIMRTGAWNEQEIAQDLSRRGALKNAAAFKAAAEPVIRELDAQARADRSEASFMQTVARQQKAEETAEAKTAYTKQNASIKGIDFSMIQPGEGNAGWHQAADDANDSGVPYTKEQYAIIDRKAARDVQERFERLTTNAERFALGTYDSWEEWKRDFGHQLSESQDKIGRSRWESAHNYTERLNREAGMKARKDEALLQRTYQLINAATAEKPASLGRGELDLMPSDELVKMDPRVVKNYDRALDAKEGLLRKHLIDATRKRDEARLKAKGINDTPELRRQYDWRVDLAGFSFDAKAGDEDVKATEAELKIIAAKRAERRGTPVLAAPGTPEPRPAPAQPPQVKYKAGPGGQYIPQAEAGIAAHMRANKIGRAKAIEQLRDAGVLE